MEDISAINSKIFRATSEAELMATFPDIVESIEHESEYDQSGVIPFLPVNRLNSAAERQSCLRTIANIIESGHFTSGPCVAEVENVLKHFYQAHACIATSSGTDGLHIALRAVGVGAGDEVIMPVNSFSATENAVMATGAMPVFANIDESWNMAPTEIERLLTPRTKAILAVCLYGSVKNMNEISRLARDNNIPVIIDAAQCFGIKVVFSYCDLMVLSFNPFKNTGTCGKSGAVLTNNPELALQARQFSYHGFAEGKKNLKVQNWGLNSRMDNIQAATLRIKMTFSAQNAAKRSFLAARYLLSLRHLSAELLLPSEINENSWHLFPLFLKNKSRYDLLQFAQARHVELDVYYPLLSHCGEHALAVHYPDREQFLASERLHASLIHLPLHNHMSLQEQDTVIEVLNAFFH